MYEHAEAPGREYWARPTSLKAVTEGDKARVMHPCGPGNSLVELEGTIRRFGDGVQIQIVFDEDRSDMILPISSIRQLKIKKIQKRKGR